MQITHNERLREEKRKVGTWGYLNKSRLAAILKYAGKQVLDVGCSTGSCVRYLCELGYDAYGFDFLEDERWQNKHTSRFLVADASHLLFKNATFDTILCFEVLEHLENVDLALEEFHRVCRSNIIISVRN